MSCFGITTPSECITHDGKPLPFTLEEVYRKLEEARKSEFSSGILFTGRDVFRRYLTPCAVALSNSRVVLEHLGGDSISHRIEIDGLKDKKLSGVKINLRDSEDHYVSGTSVIGVLNTSTLTYPLDITVRARVYTSCGMVDLDFYRTVYSASDTLGTFYFKIEGATEQMSATPLLDDIIEQQSIRIHQLESEVASYRHLARQVAALTKQVSNLQ